MNVHVNLNTIFLIIHIYKTISYIPVQFMKFLKFHKFFEIAFSIESLTVSYNVKTRAPPVPRRMLENAPLKKAPGPSVFDIFIQQSNVFLYIISVFFRPDCIIIRLLTVSKG